MKGRVGMRTLGKATIRTISQRPIALAACCLAWSTFCFAAEPRLHLLMIGDTNDRVIGPSVGQDLYHLGGTFTYNVPTQNLRKTQLTGNAAQPQRILQAVRSLPVQADLDTVAIYYSGHGGYDAAAADHVLLPGRQPLAARQLRTALEQLKPRLIVILSDACSTIIPSGIPVPAYPRAKKLSPLFKSLFFDPSGLIVVSASRPGQEAAGNSGGGYFTMALVESCNEVQARSMTWEAMLEKVNQAVATDHPEARQTAYFATQILGNAAPPAMETWRDEPEVEWVEDSGSISGGAPGESRGIRFGANAERSRRSARIGGGGTATSSGPRFGVTAQQTSRSAALHGVEVTRVMPGYPGTSLIGQADGKQYFLVVGRDIITHINERPVTNYEEFVRAVAESPRGMTVRVYDTATRSSGDYRAQLRDRN